MQKRFSVDNFFLTVPEKFAGEPFSVVLQKFPVAKKFMDNGGEYQDFPSKIFCLTVPEKNIGEHFCVSKKIRYRKILCIRGVYPDFPSKVYCLTVPKTFVEKPFCV